MDQADLLYGDLPASEAPGARDALRPMVVASLALALLAGALLAATVLLGVHAARVRPASPTAANAYPVEAAVVGRYDGPAQADRYLAVRFRDRDGVTRYGRVHGTQGGALPTGERLRIWVDPDLPTSLNTRAPDDEDELAPRVFLACIAGVVALIVGLRAALLLRRTLRLRRALRGAPWRSGRVCLAPVRIANDRMVVAAIEVAGEIRRATVPGAWPAASGYPSYEWVRAEVAASSGRTMAFRLDAYDGCWLATVPRSRRAARIRSSAYDDAIAEHRASMA